MFIQLPKVRVWPQGVAGPNWGAGVHTPAGTEVLVDFVDGDIDRPIIVGQLHNGQHDLPWPAGEDSGANHVEPSRAGTCPIWTAAAPANGWWTTAKANCACAWATHGSRGGWSELSLGHIIAHSGSGGAGHANVAPGWAKALRPHRRLGHRARRPRFAAQHHRPHGTRCQCASTQMDATEAVAQLKAAQQLGQALSQSAQQQGAQALHGFDAQQAVQCHTDAMLRKPKANTAAVSTDKRLKNQGSHPGRPRRKVCQALGAP